MNSDLKKNVYDYILKDWYDANSSKKYIESLNINSNYLWSDVNNLSSEKDLCENYRRVYIISRAYSDVNNSYYQSTEIYKKIVYSLNFLSNYYNKNTKKTGNWWEWVIGIPMYYGYILTLVPYTDKNFADVIDKFVRSYLYKDLTYANLASDCKNLLVAAIVLNDDNWEQESLKCSIKAFEKKSKCKIKFARSLQNLCVKLKWNAPVSWFAGKEGLYDDGTFIQHTSVPYIGTYGIEVLQYAAFVLSIGMTLPKEIVDILPEWISAYKKSIFKDKMLITYCGRAVETANESNIANNINRYINEIQEYLDCKISVEKSFIQPNSDKCIYEYNKWKFVVSMCSDRISKYESFNNQNKEGWYQNFGMTYLYLPNTTYTGYFNKINPYFLPGTTCLNSKKQISESKHPLFNYTKKDIELLRSGGVKFNDKNMSALMQVVDENKIIARKSWFMVDDRIICIGTNIAKDTHTTLFNLQDIKSQDISIDNNCITINNFGTIVYTNKILLTAGDENGYYMYIPHSVDNSDYLYTIIPNKKSKLKNTFTHYYNNDVHAVKNKNTYFFNFFTDKNENVELDDLCISSKEPSSVIVQKEECEINVTVSDFTQEYDNIHLRIKGNYYSITDNVKCKVDKEYTNITIPCKDKLGERIFFVLEEK